MNILIATNNKHKVREISQIFAGTDLKTVSPAQINLSVEVEEDGNTFAENALKKARGFCEASGLICVADDSGLTVECLSGEPGVYSARYGGEGLDDKGRTQLLLKNMSGAKNRRAAFVSSVAMVFPDGRVVTAEGRCEGRIALAPSGNNGFGYDPVFVPDGYDKTFSELSEEEKNRISHRGRALEALEKKLLELGILK